MSKLALEARSWYNMPMNIVVSGGATNTPDRINLFRRFIMDTLPLRAQNGNTFMYSLIDPVTEQERYIGKTDTPQRRLKEHLQDRRKTHKSNWIASLLSRGLEPAMRILEEVPVTQWQERERYWIAYYRSLGCPLTNGSDGGDGIINPTPEDRAKRSENTRRIMSDVNERARRVAKLHSPEAAMKRTETLKSLGPSFCLKVSKSKRYVQERSKGKESKKDKSGQEEQSHPKGRYLASGRGRGQRFAEEQYNTAKSTFLAAYATSRNVSRSCVAAGISRKTFYNWRDSDEQFRVDLDGIVDARQYTTSRQEVFLQEFAVTGNIGVSARASGVDRTLLYYWIEINEQFRLRFHAIKAELESMYE